MIRTLLDSPHPFLRGITLDRLEREPFVRLNIAPIGDPFLPFAQGGFGTPSGKCNFHAATLSYAPPIESRHGDSALRARFPLELISPKHDDTTNSTFGNRPENDLATAVLHIESSDAAARDIASGDQVRVFNQRGACLLRAEVDGVVPRGVVCAPAVRWARNAPDGRNVNALVSERLTDIGGGPTFYSCLVQVEKSGD